MSAVAEVAPTREEILAEIVRKKDEFEQARRNKLREAGELLSKIEMLKGAPFDVEIGGKLRVRNLKSSAGPVIEAAKGQVVIVRNVELRTTCQSGIRVHFQHGANFAAADLCWFEAVEQESEVAE